MDRTSCWIMVGLVVACGGRTTLGEVVRVGADAATELDASDPPPPPPPRGAACFPGAIALTPNVVCSVSPSHGNAAECTSRLSCNERTTIDMHCVNGTCECTNVDRDKCGCTAPDLHDPCGKNNCCWD